MEDKPVECYAINGIFIENKPTMIRRFGGYFDARIGRHEPRQGVFNVPFSGMLVDIYGNSDIHGEMNYVELYFEKRYRNGQVFEYKFKKEGELWVGEYKGVEIGGKTLAKIHMDWEGKLTPVFEEGQPFSPEELIEQMITNETLIEAKP